MRLDFAGAEQGGLANLQPESGRASSLGVHKSPRPRPASDRWLYRCGKPTRRLGLRRAAGPAQHPMASPARRQLRHRHRDTEWVARAAPPSRNWPTRAVRCSIFNIRFRCRGCIAWANDNRRGTRSVAARGLARRYLNPHFKIAGSIPRSLSNGSVTSRRPSWQTRASIAMRCL